MYILVIVMLACGTIGSIFFSVAEIHNLNRTIKNDNQEIGTLITKNKGLEEELSNISEKFNECNIATSTDEIVE